MCFCLYTEIIRNISKVFISCYVFTKFAKLAVHTFISFVWMIFQDATDVYKKVKGETVFIN